MRSNCCVIGCKPDSEGSAERRLFLVPVQPSRRKAWLNAVGRSRTTQNQAYKKDNHLYVCSAHFIGKAKSNVPGNPDYVPRLNLPRSLTLLIDRKRKTISARAKCNLQIVFLRHGVELRMQPQRFVVHRPVERTATNSNSSCLYRQTSQIDDLPMEVLEIILTKAYASYFYRVQPRPRDKGLFVILSSISQNWHKTICRRRFKSSLSRRLSLVRQLSVKFSGEFVLPRNSRAFTILDDKVYVLTDAEIWVHQYMAPYVWQFRVVFPPPSKSLAVYPDYREIGGCLEACHHAKCIYGVRSHDQRIWKFTTPEYNLEVWMHYLATLCSLSVTSNGNVLILKYEGQGLADGAYCLEMYTKDAVPVYNINLDMPSLVMRPESPSVLEISPGNFAIKCRNVLLVKSVNFDTLTTTDQNRIQYPYIERKPDHGHMGSIALYSVNRLIAVLNSGLAILDSRLNAEIILNSSIGHADTLHYRKDKRQLMACSSGMKSVQIYTLQYEGEDSADDCALERL